MASPDGLRLYFGRRAPPEVLDIIFEFGFHLWLARPHDIMRVERWYRYRTVYATTALLVREEQLSAYARALVWANYQKTFRESTGGWDLARPFVIYHNPNWVVEYYWDFPQGLCLTWTMR